jgi:Fic family protein
MILPFDTGVFSDVSGQLDRWAQRLDERILSRRWEGRLRRALEAEAVAASTSMEGVPVTVDDTLKILAGGDPETVSPKDQALVRGYRDAMTYVQRRADDGSLAWNRELIVGVQDRIVAGDVAAGAGRLRTGAAWITNNRSGQVVFEPPPPDAVPDLVDEICRTIDEADWHPVVTAAWTHVAIAAVHPFLDGNGRTARVFSSLAMYRGGFRHPAFTNLEEWWGKNPDSYYKAFDCLGERFDPGTDVTSFVVNHAFGQLSQVWELAFRQRVEGMLWTTLENVLEDRGLPERLANALYDSFFGRDITTSYYRDMIGASAATARNDIIAATAAGLLRAEGRTRGRRYTSGTGLVQALANVLDTEEASGAVVEELRRRTLDSMDWFRPEEFSPVQKSLPGVD